MKKWLLWLYEGAWAIWFAGLVLFVGGVGFVAGDAHARPDVVFRTDRLWVIFLVLSIFWLVLRPDAVLVDVVELRRWWAGRRPSSTTTSVEDGGR